MTKPFQSNYIDLLKKTLIDYKNINAYEYYPLTFQKPNWKTRFLTPLDKILRSKNFGICKIQYITEYNRTNGLDRPANAETMIGLKRLNNIEECIHTIINDNVEGDFIETGVWRGGATILMRAVLKELNITDRKVWLADSFEGLPKPDAKFEADAKSDLHTFKNLQVSVEGVKDNFRKYDLLDDKLVFLKGWFKDTLPTAAIEKISLLRLDGDLYESTIIALQHLYPKLSVGGFVIIDDYHVFDYCKQAVEDYRKEHNITEKIIDIDRDAVYWRKEKQIL